jgi:type IV pilus assembly protein PilE
MISITAKWPPLMNHKGFNLLELLVTVTIIGILAMIAYPSYVGHTTKTRRAEAMSILLQDAGFMERYYTENGCYRNRGTDKVCGSSDDTNPTLPFIRSPAEGSTIFYDITLDNAGKTKGSTFILTATPKTGKPQANDGTLTIDNNGQHGWSKNPSGNTQSWQ